jgi:anti-sigma factor RsiW
MFGPIAAEPIPARLNPRRLAAVAASRRTDWSRIAAAAVLLVALSGGIGWYLRGATSFGESTADLLIDGAVTAHALYVAESTHAVEVGADDKAHLISWLSSRLGQPIGAPDLSAQGFALVGGRLLPPLAKTGTGPAAQLMYQNASSSRLTVYITAASSHPGNASEIETEKGLEAYYWANDQITCTVVGDATDPNMQTLARGVYEQLSWRPDPPARW